MAVGHRFVKAILRIPKLAQTCYQLPKPKRGVSPFILRSFSRGEDVQTSLPCVFGSSAW